MSSLSSVSASESAGSRQRPRRRRRQMSVVDEQSTPLLRRIEVDTDLSVAPPNWLLQSDDATVNPFVTRRWTGRSTPEWTKLWTAPSSGGSGSASASSSPEHSKDKFSENNATAALIDLAVSSSVDYVGTADAFKRLFTMPYNSDRGVSLAIHRVGKTLMVQELDKEAADSDEFCEYESGETLDALGTSEQPPPIVILDGASEGCAPLSALTPQAPGSPPTLRKRRDVKKNRKRVQARKLLSKFYYSSVAARSSAAADNSSTVRGSNEEWNTGFRRLERVELNGMNLVVGSNMVVYKCGNEDENQEEAEQAACLRLNDEEKQISKESVLDYYLANRMASVPLLAMCDHKRGRLTGYRMYRTCEILRMPRDPVSIITSRKKNRKLLLEKPAYTAKEVEKNAQQLLEFLKEQCKGDGHAYWLFKGSGESVMRLYMLTSEHSISVGTPEAQYKWQYTLAMLCYRVALKMMRKDGDDARSWTRRCDLLTKCASLLKNIADTDGPKRYRLRRSIHEELAEWLRRSVQASMNEGEPSDDRASGPAPSSKKVVMQAMQKLRFAVYQWQQALACEVGDQASRQRLDQMLFRARRGTLSCFVQCAQVQRAAGSLRSGLASLHRGLSECFGLAERASPYESSEPFAPEKGNLLAKCGSFDIPRRATEAFVLYGDMLLQLGRSGASASSQGKFMARIDELEAAVLRLLDHAQARKRADAASVDDRILNLITFDMDSSFLGEEGPEKLRSVERLVILGAKCYQRALELDASAIETSHVCGNEKEEEEATHWRRSVWKLGNALNELGKLRLHAGRPAAAVHVFQQGISAFTTSNDSSNAALLSCNLAHLYRSLASSGKHWTLYVERAICVLEEALKILERSGERKERTEWVARVRSELGMAHLTYGAKLRAVALSTAAPSCSEELAQAHQSIVVTLNRALNIYQTLGKIFRHKTAAVHYHLGMHQSWMYSLPLKTPKAFARAKFHLQTALDSFDPRSSEALQCRVDLARLLIHESSVEALRALSCASGTEVGENDSMWAAFRVEILSALKVHAASTGQHAAKEMYRKWLLRPPDASEREDWLNRTRRMLSAE